ncbi:tetratricopeptide repeat protein [Streptomyces sp. 4N509B]|uniref:tetratricopeptide repeat protein n=1 Tax=Streptomyces sp. 4N509B TaxID=3457413 RepID=UPI003FD1B059
MPRQLLPVPAHFTGRETDLDALDDVWNRRNPASPLVIVVTGPGGVGKTALVSRWLGDRSGEFPDGQLYADLRGFAPGTPPSAAEVLGMLLRAFGETEVPASVPELTARWRSVTSGLRFALMLDNAATAAQVRTLLPSAPGSLVVVTSRLRLTGLVADGATFHPLGLLDDGAAVELLSRSVGRERVEREQTEAHEVVRLCAFLPLAVCLAGARLAARPEQPLTSLVASLSRGLGRLAALSGAALLAEEDTPTMQSVLDESYAALRPEVARLYRCLGVLPVTEFDAALTAAASGLDEADADVLLDVLVEVNLLEAVGPDRYRFHDLVRLHAEQRGRAEEAAPVREEWLRRLVDWCLARATAAEALLAPQHRTMPREYLFEPATPAPFTEEREALTWMKHRHESLMAVLRAADAAGWDRAVWQMVDAMWPSFLRQRAYDSWIEGHGLAAEAARRDGHRAAESRMLTSGGKGLRMAGRPEEAVPWLTRALQLAREDNDPLNEAQALSALGSCHRVVGRLAAASELYEQALALREAAGNRRQTALARLRLGEVASEEGRYGDAVEYLRRARTDLLAERDRYDAPRARALLGFALGHGGNDAARRAGESELRGALTEFEAAGSEFWQGRTWELMGELAEDCGDAPAARDCLGRAGAIYGRLSRAEAQRVTESLRRLERAEDPRGAPSGRGGED